jgi:hypothetical protein
MWLLRISLVSLVAAVSVALWLCLAPLVYRQRLGMAVGVGLISPLIVLAIGSPVTVFALFSDIGYWLVFPTGALTGALIWASLSIGQESGRGKPKHIAGLRGLRHERSHR